ncbi:hypothetical protein Tsubulata_019029 [Turnera subulata]|uniref:Uncharacterized protein n=1 Tax=Turnera subulata TaxID=218843 RepID=A0A9Q0FZH9_9ROSI|nr:hypothetical protein Tsubulata_019029 [Turnera subulata]
MEEFRCVSKFWLHLLSSTEFTRDHIASLLRQPTIESPPPTTQKLAVSTNTGRIFSLGWKSILDVSTKNAVLEYQLEDNGLSASAFWENEDEEDENEIIDRPIEIVGTSNGWVCVGRGEHLYLFESSGGKYHRVPPEDVSGFPVDDFLGFGFAYDPASDDYKVVRIIFDTVAVYSMFIWRTLFSMPISLVVRNVRIRMLDEMMLASSGEFLSILGEGLASVYIFG